MRVLDEQSPEETIKFKATEDVIPTEESAEKVIPEHEEHHADASEENGAEENVDPIPRRQPAHPRVTNEVQIEKIISDINAPSLSFTLVLHLHPMSKLLNKLNVMKLKLYVHIMPSGSFTLGLEMKSFEA